MAVTKTNSGMLRIRSKGVPAPFTVTAESSSAAAGVRDNRSPRADANGSLRRRRNSSSTRWARSAAGTPIGSYLALGLKACSRPVGRPSGSAPFWPNCPCWPSPSPFASPFAGLAFALALALIAHRLRPAFARPRASRRWRGLAPRPRSRCRGRPRPAIFAHPPWPFALRRGRSRHVLPCSGAVAAPPGDRASACWRCCRSL